MQKFIKKSVKFVKKASTVNRHNVSLDSTCDSYDIDGFEYVYDGSITTEKVERPPINEVKQATVKKADQPSSMDKVKPTVKNVKQPPVKRGKLSVVMKMVPVDTAQQPGQKTRVTFHPDNAQRSAKSIPPESKVDNKPKPAVEVPRKTCPNNLHDYDGCLCGTRTDCYRLPNRIEKDPHNTDAELDVTQDSTVTEPEAPLTLNRSSEVPTPAVQNIAETENNTFCNDKGAFLIVLFFVAVWLIKFASNLGLVGIIISAISFALALVFYLKPKRLEFVLI